MKTSRAWKGLYARGMMDAFGIQHKQVAIMARVHPSTLSRWCSGDREINETQEIQVFVALGKATEQSQKAK